MAKVARQDEAIKKVFQKRIDSKVKSNRTRAVKNARRKSKSSGLRKLMSKAVARKAFNKRQRKNVKTGREGERAVAAVFRHELSKDWTVMNDVVLEPEPRRFIQLDHVLLGPSGIYLVETKSWKGSFRGKHDEWERQSRDLWLHCESPTTQNLRHQELFNTWLTGYISKNGFKFSTQQVIRPVVLFASAQWLSVVDCSMPVFLGVEELIDYVQSQSEVPGMDKQTIRTIVEDLAHPKYFSKR